MLSGKKNKKKGMKKKKDRKKKKGGDDENKKKEENVDPLTQLGYGICAYREINWMLACMFGLFSLMVLPQIKMFQQGTAYENLAA